MAAVTPGERAGADAPTRTLGGKCAHPCPTWGPIIPRGAGGWEAAFPLEIWGASLPQAHQMQTQPRSLPGSLWVGHVSSPTR